MHRAQLPQAEVSVHPHRVQLHPVFVHFGVLLFTDSRFSEAKEFALLSSSLTFPIRIPLQSLGKARSTSPVPVITYSQRFFREKTRRRRPGKQGRQALCCGVERRGRSILQPASYDAARFSCLSATDQSTTADSSHATRYTLAGMFPGKLSYRRFQS